MHKPVSQMVCVCEAIWVNAAYLFSNYVTRHAGMAEARKLLNKSLGKSPPGKSREREMKTRICVRKPKGSERTQYIREFSPFCFSCVAFASIWLYAVEKL